MLHVASSVAQQIEDGRGDPGTPDRYTEACIDPRRGAAQRGVDLSEPPDCPEIGATDPAPGGASAAPASIGSAKSSPTRRRRRGMARENADSMGISRYGEAVRRSAW